MQTKTNYNWFPFILVFYEIANYLSNDSYIPALPDLARDFLVTSSAAQLTFTVWFLGGLTVQLFLGPLSDRYGRRPILLIGGVIFIASTLLCTFAPTISLLLIGRYIQGAAVPSMIIAGYASIHELLESHEATHVLAKMQSITILAPLLGPLLGSVLLLIGNWRWIFGLIAIWGIFGLTLLYYKMPETLPKEKRHATIKIGSIANQYHRLLKNLSFIKNIVAGCLSVSTLIAWMLVGPFLVMNQYHYSPVYFGVLQVLIFGSFTIGTRLVKRLIAKYDRDQLTMKGLAISLSTGTLSFILTYCFPHSLEVMIILLMLMSATTGLCFPMLTRLAIEASNEPMGVRMSMVSMMQFLFVVITSGVVSIFYNGTLHSLACMAFIFSLSAFFVKQAYKRK